jgi:hypothetical protein
MFGANDFFSYYKLYDNWDFRAVEAPFNMRLVSSFFVFLLHKTGLHYGTEIAFDQFALQKQVFFTAVFFNYMCVVCVCSVLYRLVYRYTLNHLWAFIAGLIYLLGFGTIFYELMPLTDSFSVLLFALALGSYLKKSYYVLPFLSLAILQREYILMAFCVITLLDFIRYRERYFLYVLVMSFVFFAVYFVLRKTYFYTPLYDHQASPGYFADSMFHLKFSLSVYIRQSLMTLNIFIIYLGLIAYKMYHRMAYSKWEFFKILFLFLQINVISVAAVFGNNMGRYFYILIPLIIYQIIVEAIPLVDNQTGSNGKSIKVKNSGDE